MESFVLTALHETLHTFERFQRHYSKDHNSHVKVGFFIFLWWQRDIHNQCNTVLEFFTFPISSFDIEHNAWDSVLIERCTIWDPHLISCKQLSCESLLLLLIQCIFTFVTDKTAFWTNMTTNSWTCQDLHISQKIWQIPQIYEPNSEVCWSGNL